MDLNVGYGRSGIQFFHQTTENKTTFSGASTDVVAHEVGHGLLDSINPDLFSTPFSEPDAFHEGFADCIALLTGLSDLETRRQLLAVSPNLDVANFVESTTEDLADGRRRANGPQDPASEPRHALNTFQFQLPGTLPLSGPPAVLTREPHSFGRIMSGYFYDLVRNLFTAQANRNEAALLTAVQTAARLLIPAARTARPIARYFREIGRLMILEDQSQNGGTHRDAIRNAFDGHGIALGSAALLAPVASLAGAAPKLAPEARAAIVSPTTRRDLLRHLGAPEGTHLAVNRHEIAGEPVAVVVHRREVPLDDVSERLAGVVVPAPEPVLLGASGTRAAILGGLPDPALTTDEVFNFVQTLLEHDRIALDHTSRTETGRMPTHAVRSRGGKKVLTRLRFLCHCHDRVHL